jgi:signal transduction histidine kinase
MKNAMRATVEHSRATGRMEHPPIEVTIVQGVDDISIRLRDQGGGIPAASLPFVFDYSFTSVAKEEDGGLSRGF